MANFDGFMIKQFSGLLAMLLLSCSGLYSQDSIVLFNGKTLTGNVTNDKNLTFVSCEFQKGKKLKSKLIAKEDIFGIYYKDSIVDTLYAPIAAEEITFTFDEMQRFISGEQLARAKYHPRWATICGAATGLGGIYLGFYGMLIPTAFVAVASSTPVKPVKKKYFPPDRANDEFFIEGFKQEAKRKKLVNSVIGGVSGFLVLGTAMAIMTSLDYKNWGK